MINVDIYTDGASKGNPGPAGYGWVMLIKNYKLYRSYGLGYATNNQSELKAVINSLEELLYNLSHEDRVDGIKSINIYSDSQYVCNAFNKKWINKWIKENFIKIKNPELWINLNEVLGRFPLNADINFIWIKGHNGNEYNEEADSLAQMACGHEGIVMQGYNKI